MAQKPDVIEAEVLSEVSTYQDVRGVRNDTGRVLRRGEIVWWRVNAAGLAVALATGQRGKPGCGLSMWVSDPPTAPGQKGTAALVGTFRVYPDGGRSGLYLEERSTEDRPALPVPVWVNEWPTRLGDQERAREERQPDTLEADAPARDPQAGEDEQDHGDYEQNGAER